MSTPTAMSAALRRRFCRCLPSFQVQRIHATRSISAALFRTKRCTHPARQSSQVVLRSYPSPIAKRHLQTEIFWMPPLFFVGLLGALWIWKCAMMVLFQNKIIYMPGIPPTARRERIEDYVRECGGVKWEERRIRSVDGTAIALCVAEVEAGGTRTTVRGSAKGEGDHVPTPVYILYFQGNASSLPPRLQDISSVLGTLEKGKQRAHFTVICLSYRGYWRSKGRPSEKGINLDARAALDYAGRLHSERYADAKSGTKPEPRLIFWGQSIGSGIATNLAAWEGFPATCWKLTGLVLETPFTSVRAMLGAVYPPKWAPYRYLGPFLRNHLDSLGNLDKIALRKEEGGGKSGDRSPFIAIVEAGKDELVPAEHGVELERRCRELGLLVERKTVQGAFHNDIMFRAGGRKAVADAIETAVVEGCTSPSQAKSSWSNTQKGASSTK